MNMIIILLGWSAVAVNRNTTTIPSFMNIIIVPGWSADVAVNKNTTQHHEYDFYNWFSAG